MKGPSFVVVVVFVCLCFVVVLLFFENRCLYLPFWLVFPCHNKRSLACTLVLSAITLVLSAITLVLSAITLVLSAIYHSAHT